MSPVDKNKLEACEGWEDWMSAWVYTTETPCGYLTIYVCVHPDQYPFYASTVPQQAVSAFSKPEYAYNG